MGTILIDKLLSACVKQGASDLHITVGQPPVLRISGRLQRLKTKVLEPADTQALMVDYLNDNFDHHIITIEDPIEFQHEHKKSTINQREVGVDVTSFSEAIRRALRQDPDVILVGEMRDLETIEAAITAAETRDRVFGTLHTHSAQGTINPIIDVFPHSQQDQIRTQLSTSIIAVLAQTLLPKIGGGRMAAYEILVVTSG